MNREYAECHPKLRLRLTWSPGENNSVIIPRQLRRAAILHAARIPRKRLHSAASVSHEVFPGTSSRGHLARQSLKSSTSPCHFFHVSSSSKKKVPPSPISPFLFLSLFCGLFALYQRAGDTNVHNIRRCRSTLFMRVPEGPDNITIGPLQTDYSGQERGSARLLAYGFSQCLLTIRELDLLLYEPFIMILVKKRACVSQNSLVCTIHVLDGHI